MLHVRVVDVIISLARVKDRTCNALGRLWNGPLIWGGRVCRLSRLQSQLPYIVYLLGVIKSTITLACEGASTQCLV